MNNQEVNSKILVDFLKSQNKANAKLLDKIKINYRPYICPFDEILNEIPQGASVFDIGCGSGMLLSLISNFRSPHKLGGCEIDAYLIENSQELLNDQKNVELFTFNGSDLPKSLADYDYITLVDVLHHVPVTQQWDFMKSICELMKKDAVLIVKDIEGDSILKYWNKIHDLLLASEIGNEISSTKLSAHLKDSCGMSIEKTYSKRMLLYPHYTIIAKKP